jgi:galacturan 1,4-alpha-galacturonidase
MVDANNMTFTDFTMHNTTETGVFYITQCTTFSGVAGDCNTSLFNIRNIHFTNIRGTVGTSYVASMQRSKASSCTGIDIKDIDLTLTNGTAIDKYSCKNVEDTVGFSC